jgi:hypothetical protein
VVPSKGDVVSRASEQRAAAKRAEQRRQIEDFAASFRQRAAQQSYAGCDGEYVAYAVASVFDELYRHWDTVPEPVLRQALAAARYHLQGPSGANDPRGRLPSLSDGPGH